MSNDKVKEMKDEDKNTPDLHPYGHEMSDKDPVREQIEMDAVSFNPDSIYRITAVRDEQLKFFKKGATHQDPIAWNRCLDEVNALSITSPFVMDEYIVISKKDLEKLRR